ncbi:YqhG family protein [Paenibacillus sp. P25]|nr:YqhG family protein [Paenibacillus sp. P25]
MPTTYTARIPRDDVTFGDRRLEQLFAAVRTKGRFVRLFEHYVPEQPRSSATLPYESWLGVNYKIEFTCDMKRSELHSFGIQLQTGEIRERFHDLLLTKKLTPRLPAHVYITPDRIALPRAVLFLEEYIGDKIAAYDHTWAEEAQLRLAEELIRVGDYYEPPLKAAEPDKRAEIEAQYANRRNEIDWQYRPRVQISVINCGLFHFPAVNGPMS